MLLLINILIYIMFFISHRGNLNGPDARHENSIEYINHALESISC